MGIKFLGYTIFLESGIATLDDLSRLKQETALGLFIRSLVGLDREAAKTAFAEFHKDKTLNSSQIEFIDMIINYLTERGIMEPRLLYESPFTDMDDMGIEGFFPQDQVVTLIGILEEVKNRAAA